MLLLKALGESLSLPLLASGGGSSGGIPCLSLNPWAPDLRLHVTPLGLSGLGPLYADASHGGFRVHPVPVWDLLLA